MKFFLAISWLAVVSALGTEDDRHVSLDTARGEAIFAVATRKSGHTYIDTMDMQILEHVTLGSEDADVSVDLHMENAVLVSDLSVGGKEVDVTTRRVKMTMGVAGEETACDSLVETEEPFCQVMFNLVGQSQVFTIDDEGTVAEESSEDASPLAKVGPKKQLEQSSRLLQLIPSHPVQPGESWDASADMGDDGFFSGRATLLGYKEHDGADCAVISAAGTSVMDAKVIEAKLQDAGMAVSGLEMGDVAVSFTVYWDDNMKLTRWSKQHAGYDMKMDSPIGGPKANLSANSVTYTSSTVFV